MKRKSQLLQSINRFKEAFWAKKTIYRPPIGIIPEGVFIPIKYLREQFLHKRLNPLNVNDDLYINDYDFALANCLVQSDDFMPF